VTAPVQPFLAAYLGITRRSRGMLSTLTEENMATTAELTRIVDRLEERVANHITFFRVACGGAVMWLGAISAGIYSINGSIGRLQLPQRVEQSSLTPTDRKSQAEAAQLIEKARKTSIPLSQAIIEQAGKRFAEAGRRDEGAWKTAIQFVDYRSSVLNSSLPLPVAGKEVTDLKAAVDFIVRSTGVGKHSVVIDRPDEDTTADHAARLQLIGDHLEDPNLAPSYTVIAESDETLMLDRLYAKNVIFMHFKVEYNGGPLYLQNVSFIDCKFNLQQGEPQFRLETSLLSPGPASFDSSATGSIARSTHF
jgi:hypothetical protein